jgi:hypothetical protein
MQAALREQIRMLSKANELHRVPIHDGGQTARHVCGGNKKWPLIRR